MIRWPDNWPDQTGPVAVMAPKGAGVGLRIPEREADCSGVRPSWYPFQMNVCDVDTPADPPLTAREMHVPAAP